jgi:hypothetical protein
MNEGQPLRAVGIFADQKDAIEAARALVDAGFAPDRITLVAQDWKSQELAALGVEVQKGASTGSVTGAAIGGSVGAAVGLMTLLIPGIGAGVLALTALAAATGAATGSLWGAFAGMEMSEAEAREHAAHVQRGYTVVVVRTPDRADEANRILVEHGAHDFSMSTD